MDKLEDYEKILFAVKELVKSEKAKIKASDNFMKMDFHNYTQTRRARASDRLTDACFSVDKARDYLHKILVDTGFTSVREVEFYKTREISQSAGFGHSICFKYTPPIPDCIRQDMEA